MSAKENAITDKDATIKDMKKKVKKVKVQIKKQMLKSLLLRMILPCTSIELKDHAVEHTYTVMVLRKFVNNLIDE